MKVLESEMQKAATEFVAGLRRGKAATIITLSGGLGAGKTTFTQGVARALGVTETVASPTFVIEKIYELKNQLFQRLIHIDTYRLKSQAELVTIGWEEIIADPDNLILLEWPEAVPGAIPESATAIRFDIEGEGRIITFTYGKENTEKDTGATT